MNLPTVTYAHEVSQLTAPFRRHGRKKKIWEENRYTHHVCNRSFIEIMDPRAGVSFVIKRWSRERERPKKNRRARYLFRHLFGMPLAPSPTLLCLIFFLSLFLFLFLAYPLIPLRASAELTSRRPSPIVPSHFSHRIRKVRCSVLSQRSFRPSASGPRGWNRQN